MQVAGEAVALVGHGELGDLLAGRGEVGVAGDELHDAPHGQAADEDAERDGVVDGPPHHELHQDAGAAMMAITVANANRIGAA